MTYGTFTIWAKITRNGKPERLELYGMPNHQRQEVERVIADFNAGKLDPEGTLSFSTKGGTTGWRWMDIKEIAIQEEQP